MAKEWPDPGAAPPRRGRIVLEILLIAGFLAAAVHLLAQTGRSGNGAAGMSTGELLWNYRGILAKGTWTTIKISVMAMALASSLGLLIAIVRLYGHWLAAALATLYVEFMRGTPLLVQLYFIYYGLPSVGITLDAMVVAVVGVGLNYAAYESEIYRAGLMAVPRAQTEAALALGLTRGQAIRLVVLPQALRLVIPPVTNDFVSLFKDTSIVSVLAVVELTKTFQTAAIGTNRYMEFALVTGIIYFVLAYPLALLARHLERRIHPHHDRHTQPD